MEKVLQAAGMSWLEVCEWHSGQDWSTARILLKGEAERSTGQSCAGGAGMPLRQLLRTLTLASLACGTAMHAIMLRASSAGDGGETSAQGSPAGDSAATQCVAVTADVLALLCMRIMHGLRLPMQHGDQSGDDVAMGGLVDGAAMHALLVVVHHTLLWLTALAVASCHGLKSSRKGADAPQQAACESGLVVLKSLLAAVQSACECLEQAVADCLASLGDGLGVRAALSLRHRRCLAEVADEATVLAELEKLGAAQKAVLEEAAASVQHLLAACRRVVAQVAEG